LLIWDVSGDTRSNINVKDSVILLESLKYSSDELISLLAFGLNLETEFFEEDTNYIRLTESYDSDMSFSKGLGRNFSRYYKGYLKAFNKIKIWEEKVLELFEG